MGSTLLQLQTRIRQDVEMEDENQLSDTQLTTFINAGISEVEREIHTLYEDYFLEQETLPIYSGQSLYSLPSNIYAAKIRAFYYNNGTTKYPIFKVKKLEDTLNVDNNETYYRYKLVNAKQRTVGTAVSAYTVGTKTLTFSAEHRLNVGDEVEVFTAGGVSRGTDRIYSISSATVIILNSGIAATIATDTVTKLGGIKIHLFPAAKATEASSCSIWYLRDATKLSADSDQIDIPEFESFVEWYAKVQCYIKEGTPDMIAAAEAMLEKERMQLRDTLQAIIPDGDTNIIPEVDFYEDYNDEFIVER